VKRTLENKIAVVTGGSGAIGPDIRVGLEQQGACVAHQITGQILRIDGGQSLGSV
jgi:NADP-dependent 3-hydroxy acid dehydrogenase YdfG